MLVYVPFQKLFGDVSPLFSQRRGAEIRKISIDSYGVTPEVIGSDELYGLMRVTPTRDKQNFVGWLGFIQAEAVTVEPDDLAVMVPDKVIRTGMQQNWSAVAGSLDKLQPDELYTALENAAIQVFTAQPTQVTSADTRFVRDKQEDQTLAALKAAGVADPLEKWNRYDELKEREAAEYRDREDQKTSDWMGIEPDTEPAHMTLQEQVRAAKEQAARQNGEN